jgi:hypothetical protein
MKSAVFWIVTLCSSETAQYFGETHHLHLQDQRVSLARKDTPQLRQLVAGFPLQWPGVEPRRGHVGFVVDKVALGQPF